MSFLVNSPARLPWGHNLTKMAGRERGSWMPANQRLPRTLITGTPGARPALGRRRVLLLLLGVFGGCRRKKKISLPPPRPARVGESEVGIASWYGHPYHGRRTSNGEVYDMNKMTAAHLRLPFNTWVRVRNLRNRRTVDVRITDRGPFIKGRIIDLSRAAAKQIRMIGPGTAKVRVKVIATPKMRYKPEKQRSVEEPVAIEQPIEPQESAREAHALEAQREPCPSESSYGVQVGLFRVPENAERMLGKMLYEDLPARIVRKQDEQGLLYSVVVGQEDLKSAAEFLQRSLENEGISGFVTAFDESDLLDCL